MNMPHKFVADLSDEDYQKLMQNYQTDDNFRVRQRSRHLNTLRFSIDRRAI